MRPLLHDALRARSRLAEVLFRFYSFADPGFVDEGDEFREGARRGVYPVVVVVDLETREGRELD